MSLRTLLKLSIAAALAIPMQAQFIFTVQQNGQGTSEANGGSITMNAPTLTTNVSATVVVTYIGTNTANFPNAGEILGASNFTVTGGDGPMTLSPFQSTTFVFHYSPSSTAQTTAEFLWPFTETSTTNTSTGPVNTTIDSGAITFNLIGTAPNLTVGQITATGSFQTIASGGTFQFPNTAVNAVSTMTIGINNAGSGPGTVNSITVTGAGYTQGSVPLLPLTIGAGNQLNFTVQFQPTAAGVVPGSLQITFANGTYTAALTGTAIGSSLSYTVTQGGASSPLTPGQTITFPGTNVSSTSTATVTFQNTGTAPLTLSSIASSGAGFSITDGPFLPITLQPQQSNSITITYAPTEPGPNTGRLQIGSDSFSLAGQGLGPTLTYSYTANGVTTPVVPGGNISFSSAVDGQTSSVQFTITNTGTVAATLASVGVVDPTGVFTISNPPAPQLQLAPAASISFTINYTPVAPGISSATLAINNSAFGLTGFAATPPPLPSYVFTGASGTQQPFQQPAIGLSLTAPYPYELFGTLTIGTELSNFGTDPAVQFSSGGNQVNFTIPANTLVAVFPSGATQIQIQTGTVAGIIKITPAFTVGTTTGTNITPPNPTILQLTIPSQAPTLLTAILGSQTATSISIVVTGFSTVRSLESLTFQLTPAAGYTLSGGTVTVDVSTTSTLWFQTAASQSSGGQFTVEVPFTFSENTTTTAATNLTAAISAVAVSATNSVGTSNVLQVSIP